MLFKQEILDRIAAGEVTAAFRRWRKPTVKAGGSLRTPAGVLVIDAVKRVVPSAITASAARKAGFSSVDELRRELNRRSEGEIYRIAFRLMGPDPRVTLRSRARVTAGEQQEIDARLARLDRNRAWTKVVLMLIAKKPGTPAAQLAERTRQETAALKRNVRKLKELGLTESLEVGYRLSPRGRAVLARLGARPKAKAR